MTDQELLQAMKTMMKEELEPIKAEIAEMKEDIAEIKEDLEATKDGVNTLLDWAEECSTVLKFPLPRIADAK